MSNEKILRMPAVLARTGYCRASIYRIMNDPRSEFPRSIKLGFGRNGAIGWRESDVDEWISKRAAGSAA